MNVSTRIRGLVVLAAAPILLVGCGSLVRQPANVEATRADVEAMRREQTELKALVLDLRTRLETQSEAIASGRADSNLELRQLAERLDVLIARVEDLGSRQDRVRRSVPVNPAPTGGDSVGVGSAAKGAGPPGSGDPGQLLDAANRDFSRGNFQLAIAGFDEVITAEPRGDMADDAQYMKGESYYGLGEVERAIQEFLKVRDVYPDGNKVAAATFKIGVAFERQGDAATARRYFETVVREFPGTPESELAKERLKNLR